MQVRAGLPVLPRIKIFYGWWVVLGCFSILFYMAGAFFYGFAAFFSPMQEDLKLSATAVSVAFALRSLEGGMEGMVVGYLVDRIGPRRIMVTGVITAGLGMIFLSRVHSLWTFYAAFLVISLGTSACAGVVGYTAVSYWFVRRRGRALAIYSTGAGFGGLLAPALVWLIARYDWRSALVIAGVGFWVIGIPAAMVVRHRPERYGYLPDGDAAGSLIPKMEVTSGVELSLKQALGTRSFWLITLAIMATASSLQVLVVHQIKYLESIEISRWLAGFVVTGMTLTSIAGRLGFGWMGDIKDKRHVLAITFGLQALGLFILAGLRAPWMLILYLAAFGPAYGGAIPLRPAILADYFGTRALGIIQGVLWLVTTLGAMASPILAGWVFDRWGTYRPVFYAFAGLTVVAIPLMLLARRPIVDGGKAKS